MLRDQLTSCIVCSKPSSYLWEDADLAPVPGSVEINGACRVSIVAGVGSAVEPSTLYGIVCDDCVQSMIANEKIVEDKYGI